MGRGTATGSRPASVRIEDLADPRFSPEVDELRAAMAAMAPEVVLEPDALMEAATSETGLDDFGDDGFRERLELLCRSVLTESGCGPHGIVSSYAQWLQLLKNRLLVEDLLKRHPEIHDVRIDRPIIVCGLPRTGTTHLHNLIAPDPALRSLPYWESLEPVLPEHEAPVVGEPDPRRARTEAALEFVNTAMPHFKRMHEMTVDHVHEEIQLLAIDFSTMLFETLAPMPTWRDYYLAHDQTPHYGYLRTVLQALQWLRGGERWVLKSPQHIEQFGPLAATFPDATFVVTHRDPVSVTTSVATMLTYTSRLTQERVDPARIGGYWADRTERMLRACVDDRHVLPADQSIDVRFDEFMADDIAMVERIYDLAGQPFTPETRAAMDAFMADHPRGKFGGVRYDLTAFGLDRDERRDALRFYVERFGITEEPSTR
ncbi:MAG: sulfotransferase [Actinobacteria bacterium]|nr:sulfotransferase [Actinomycetota bacterium]